MNGITILIWVTIALIGIIAIVAVKLRFNHKELENDEGSILDDADVLKGIIPIRDNDLNDNNSKSSSLSPQTTPKSHKFFENEKKTPPKDDAYIAPEENVNNNFKNFEYESQNQVLINYNNSVEKFQEPIKQSQMDIMTRSNKDKSELKDLFTIDELIKESKRKDSEREKESQTIKKDDDDLTEIKESIKNRKEEPLIEEVIDEKEETIGDLINKPSSDKKEESGENKTPSVATQKDIDDAISNISKEDKKDEKTTSQDKPDAEKTKKITEPTLKTPSKVGENKKDEFGTPLEESGMFDDDEEEEYMELDYRKDLDKFTNKIKGSKIFKDVKEKLKSDEEEIVDNESFIRNVNAYDEYDEYDEYEPIVNETHIDYDATYDEYHDISYEQRLRQSNTRKVFKNTDELQKNAIKDKPKRDNIKLTLNNNEVVIKKGDEIIFNHKGESYSSQVYEIKGDELTVRYRRKNITIKTSDVKKVY